MKKTKLQILKETYEYYSDPSKRAIFASGCYYEAPDGKKCAVGRCLINPKKLEYLGGGTINDVIRHNAIVLNLRLKPEYRGHEVQFWSSLQAWHDSDLNFAGDRISEEGEAVYQKLVKIYSPRKPH